MKDLLYVIYPKNETPDTLKAMLLEHSEVKFVSLVAVDLGNNSTDEKVPVEVFLEDVEGFLKTGVQTDGSSVYLPKIAEINNAKVDLIPDTEVKWIVDYNWNNLSEDGTPVGSLLIPAFLTHDGKFVCSRSILKQSTAHFESSIKELFKTYPYLNEEFGILPTESIASVNLTMATELEFWVKTPDNRTDIEKLSTSQILKEQYWKRTVGPVRTALEQSLVLLNKYDYEAEMGHKEVGGVPSKLAGMSKYSHIMEQLEVDWKYDLTLQSADNELFSKDIIRDAFVKNGLDVTFNAKPIEGVAGSGEHHHMGVAVKLSSGRRINLFSPLNMTDHFLSRIGYGALMGLLKNYEVINPFVTATNDAFNRLKPGFEAPICTVTSLGHSADKPSRNRTILVGLVRDLGNPFATRFELRAPNPHTNTYLTVSSSFQGMLDGIKFAINSQLSLDALLGELSKTPESKGQYLELNRMYRSEFDVFEHYSEEERDAVFGIPPKTVWENINALNSHPSKIEVLKDGDVFPEQIIESYKASMLAQWASELRNRLIPENITQMRRFVKCHNDDDVSDLDLVNWEHVKAMRIKLMKDSLNKKSLMTKIRVAIDNNDYDTASRLQVEMNQMMTEINHLYQEYRNNLVNIND